MPPTLYCMSVCGVFGYVCFVSALVCRVVFERSGASVFVSEVCTCSLCSVFVHVHVPPRLRLMPPIMLYSVVVDAGFVTSGFYIWLSCS